MKREEWDAIVIGAGMGGVITGAILAAKERMKVLVLEKNAQIGGRIVSFGKETGSAYSASQLEELLYSAAWSTVLKSEPEFSKIIEDGILNDFILDGGWHGMSAGDRCRYALLARALGKPLPVSNIFGVAYLQEGRWLQLPELVSSWPKESARERGRVAGERMLLSIEEAAEYDHVDLKMYLESVTSDKLVQDYYATMARWQFGINEPGRLSAGEWIKCNNATSSVGRHLIYGGGMGDVSGGFQVVATTFASMIEENGGEVRTNSTVKEVRIKDWKAQGVLVQGDKGLEEIDAPYVVCNVPVYGLYDLIPKEYFPAELRERISSMYPIGAIVGNICLKEPLETDYPKAQYLVDRLPGTEDLNIFGGQPVYGFEQTSIVDPSRAPSDKCLVQIALILSRKDPDEVGNKPLMDRLADEIIKFMKNQYPQFEDILEWYFLTKIDMAYGLEPAPGLVGDRRFPVRHPVIRNLFFTGDCVEQWDVGTNGAAHGAVICASALTGRDYLKLLPPYWR
jgi:hypothetical protein